MLPNFKHIRFVIYLIYLVIQLSYGKSVYLNGNRYENNFKQLSLPPEEIDENIAPNAPNKLEVFNNGGESVDYVIEEGTTETLDISDINLSSSLATTLGPQAESTTQILSNENLNNSSSLIKYCKCIDDDCSCCRSFNLPFIPVKGPACAKMSYLGNNKMSVSLKYGDLTLATRTISSRRTRPLCVGLPGGYSKFCGRFYSVSKPKENFKACLGFELRADEKIEASLRVSCFKFGPQGLKVAEPEPFPNIKNKDKGDEDDDDYDDEEDEEDDEDDDIFDFGGGSGSDGADDEDEDDEYEFDEDNNQKEEYDDDNDDDADDDDDDTDDDDDDDDEDIETSSSAAADDESNASNDEDVDDDDDEVSNNDDYSGFSLTGLFSSNNDKIKKTIKTPKPTQLSTKKKTKSKSKSKAKSKAKKAFNPIKIQGKDDKANIEDCTELVNSQNFEKEKIKKKNENKTSRKKNKNTKSSNEAEIGLAYEIFNELLDLFN